MKLYFTPGACSLACHIVLEELEETFTLEQVDLKTKKLTNGDDFHAINPKGYVPALILDNGTTLTEGCVINQYLADQHPEKGLFPTQGIERYQLQSLMVFIATEIHKTMGAQINPNLSDKARSAMFSRLSLRLDSVAEQLGNHEFIFNNQFSTADAYLFTVLNWSSMAQVDLAPWPQLIAYQKRIAQRPAVQRALKAEGLI